MATKICKKLIGGLLKVEVDVKKLNIAMFGDGDIIGTTKKNHVESGLLAA